MFRLYARPFVGGPGHDFLEGERLACFYACHAEVLVEYGTKGAEGFAEIGEQPQLESFLRKVPGQVHAPDLVDSRHTCL